MSSIRSRGNRNTELMFASLLRKNTIAGWRRHYPVDGTPDFAFPKRRVAIFIDGCFWHWCAKCRLMPQTNVEYWTAKLHRNRDRDLRVGAQLRQKGWSVVRIWEHELNSPSRLLKKIRALKEAIGLRCIKREQHGVTVMTTNRRKIQQLLSRLANANGRLGSRSNESRAIRRELRQLGHRGGLRNRSTA